MKHELRAVANGPSNGLGITPALVTDRDAERERSDLEHATSRARRVHAVLARIELDLVLEAHARASRIDHEHGRVHGVVDDTLGPEHDRDPSTRGGACDRSPRALEKHRIGRRWLVAEAPIAGDVTLGKADHVRALDGGSRDRVAGTRDRFFGRCRIAKIGQGDPGHDATLLCERGHRRRLLRSTDAGRAPDRPRRVRQRRDHE